MEQNPKGNSSEEQYFDKFKISSKTYLFKTLLNCKYLYFRLGTFLLDWYYFELFLVNFIIHVQVICFKL